MQFSVMAPGLGREGGGREEGGMERGQNPSILPKRV